MVQGLRAAVSPDPLGMTAMTPPETVSGTEEGDAGVKVAPRRRQATGRR